jgi:hypothetical protein
MTFADATVGVTRVISWLHLVTLADEFLSNSPQGSERLGL